MGWRIELGSHKIYALNFQHPEPQNVIFWWNRVIAGTFSLRWGHFGADGPPVHLGRRGNAMWTGGQRWGWCVNKSRSPKQGQQTTRCWEGGHTDSQTWKEVTVPTPWSQTSQVWPPKMRDLTFLLFKLPSLWCLLQQLWQTHTSSSQQSVMWHLTESYVLKTPRGKKMQVLRVLSIEIKTFSGIKISFNLIQLHFIIILPLLWKQPSKPVKGSTAF